MRLLITGGAGFLGSNLAHPAISEGDEVCVFDNLTRVGATLNLDWLREAGRFTFVHGDVRLPHEIAATVRDFRPDAVFHLSGQVAMTTSIANPRQDFETNAFGTFNVLDAVRLNAPDAAVIYSSTNKVYGDLEAAQYEKTESRWRVVDHPNGFDEQTPLDFHSPYGVSKGTGDQYCLDFHRIYGLKTIVFRHSSMYGGRQFSTADQGWIGWFCQKAFEQSRTATLEPFDIHGDGLQVRDVLEARDMVTLYRAALRNVGQVAGNAFNVGGGVANSLSLLELFALLGEITGKPLAFRRKPARASDQRVFIADIGKAQRLLGWAPQVSAREGVTAMYRWVEQTYGKGGGVAS